MPAKWHFAGTLIQGDECSPAPFVVYRATSADGLSFVEAMPSLSWVWGTGPMSAAKHSGCLPLAKTLTASEFLQYFARTMQAEDIVDEPVPADVAASVHKKFDDAQAAYAPKFAAMHAPQPTQDVQLARAAIRFHNGTFAMKGQLAVVLNCTVQTFPGLKSTLRGMADQPGSTIHRCTAAVRFIATPEPQYAATVSMLDAMKVGPTPLPEWEQAWINRSNQQTAAVLRQIDANGAAQRQATAQRFAHDAAVRNQMHAQFMASMQQKFDNFQQRQAQSQEQFAHFQKGQAANQAARQQFTSDMVDFALDRQTVADPNTGEVSKVSSTYGHTWINQSGGTTSSYQTNDVNANPNGILQGTWTEQTSVHGDGTSR